jgi:hypothetical protein
MDIDLRDPVSVRPGLFVDEFWFTLSGPARTRSASPRRLRAAVAAGVAVVLVAALLVLRMSGGVEAMVFRYAMAKGDKHTYDLSLSMSGVVAGVPDAPPIQGTVNATLGYEVISSDGSSSVVELTLSNVRAVPSMGAVPGESRMRVTIAPDGSVTKVEGSGGVFGAAGASVGSLSSIPGSPSDTAGSQFVFPQYPSEAVKPGDTWSENTTFPLPFGDNKVTINVSGTHNGFEESPYGRVAKFHHTITSPLDISFTLAEVFSAMEGAAPPPGAENAAMRITGDLSMDADSLVLPDSSDLVRLDGTGKMKMYMQMKGVPQGADGAPTDIAIDTTMKIAMIRVDGANAAA